MGPSEKKQKKSKDKKSSSGARKKEMTVSRNVIKAMRLECHRGQLAELREKDRDCYRRVIKKCRPFRTKVDGKTLVRRVFFSSASRPQEFHAIVEYASCFVSAATDTVSAGTAASVYNRPDERLATPLAHCYWRDADDQYHPLLSYVKRKDVDIKLVVLASGKHTSREGRELIAKTHRSIEKLLSSKRKKKDKKRKSTTKKEDKKKNKKHKTTSAPKHEKKRRDEEDEEEEAEDEEDSFIEDGDDSEDDSEEDDVSYVPTDDDSEDEGADPSTSSEDDTVVSHTSDDDDDDEVSTRY
jgi:hypothetical protein